MISSRPGIDTQLYQILMSIILKLENNEVEFITSQFLFIFLRNKQFTMDYLLFIKSVNIKHWIVNNITEK